MATSRTGTGFTVMRHLIIFFCAAAHILFHLVSREDRQCSNYNERAHQQPPPLLARWQLCSWDKSSRRWRRRAAHRGASEAKAKCDRLEEEETQGGQLMCVILDFNCQAKQQRTQVSVKGNAMAFEKTRPKERGEKEDNS